MQIFSLSISFLIFLDRSFNRELHLRLSCNISMFRHHELPARDTGDWVCIHRHARVGTWTVSTCFKVSVRPMVCRLWYWRTIYMHGCEYKRHDRMSNRCMEREVLFDRESLSWKMMEKKALVDGKKKYISRIIAQSRSRFSIIKKKYI